MSDAQTLFPFGIAEKRALIEFAETIEAAPAAGSVGTAALAASAVTTAKLAAASVTGAKLGAMTSAELATALSNETGTGLVVFNTSPTLVTPALGVPASGTLTNCTGLPLAGTVGSFGGAQTTRAAVRAEVGDSPAIGSRYFSTAGKMYLKVANGPADTDWQRVTTTAAD